MPSRPSVSRNREEVNCVPLSVVSVTFASRLPSGSRASTACSTAASASSVRQRCERFQPTISRVQQSMTQNPKTGTEEIRGKLGRNCRRGDEDDAQERSHGGADRSRSAAGGGRSAGGGGLSQGRDQRGHVLSLEAAVFGGGGK